MKVNSILTCPDDGPLVHVLPPEDGAGLPRHPCHPANPLPDAVAASLVRLTWNVREDFRSWAAPWKANRTVEQNCPQVLEEEM